MTTERAIELLNRISDSQFDGEYGDERREALSMAVRALESNLVKESGDLVKDLVKDCISRKMAIEAFEPTHYKDWYTPTIIETLETLPFVRPEVLACGNGELVKESGDLVKDLVKDCISRKMAIDEVKRLHDVAWANWKETRISANTMIDALKDLPSAQPETHDKRTETHECDLINRQQAIDAVVSAMIDGADAELVEGVMELLPSAQPERKNGKWIYHSNWEVDGECGYECSECGMGSDVDYNYCMRCGARMVKEGEEHD